MVHLRQKFKHSFHFLRLVSDVMRTSSNVMRIENFFQLYDVLTSHNITNKMKEVERILEFLLQMYRNIAPILQMKDVEAFSRNMRHSGENGQIPPFSDICSKKTLFPN